MSVEDVDAHLDRLTHAVTVESVVVVDAKGVPLHSTLDARATKKHAIWVRFLKAHKRGHCRVVV